jgi:amidophosphoribosyltransferase
LEDLQEKCGVFGVLTAKRYAQRATYYGLFALQHRGQESSGIASVTDEGIERHAGEGLVAHVYREEDLARLKSNLAIGHNRYATSGDGAHLQPLIDQEAGFALAHNGNLPDTSALEAFLHEHKVDFSGHNDSQMMALAIGYYMGQGQSLVDAIEAAWPLFTGAFSCVAMTRDTLVAFRDECGIRPLSIGNLEDGFAVASETCAFDTIGAAFLREARRDCRHQC